MSWASCRPAAKVVPSTCISATELGASSRKVVWPLSTASFTALVKYTLWRMLVTQ
ncbi:Uncharacterised protein [Mycobacteroides abscessus subsp. abscessus]|nr:Uncharacterised protein [Mycobacteroides abscessus subsp. abscessus]